MKPMQRIEAERKSLAQNIEEANFTEYDYPEGLDLRPRNEHAKWIVSELMERARAASVLVDNASEQWKRMDWTMSSYVPLDAAETKTKNSDWRKPVHVVVPMTFASMETYAAYCCSTFLGHPIHKLRGRGSTKAVIEAAKLERVMAAQNLWFKEGLRLDGLWRDGFTYGAGFASPVWKKHKARVPINDVVTPLIADVIREEGLSVDVGDILRTMEEEVVFEGNDLQVIDPWHMLRDPNVPAARLQDGEYAGWIYGTSSTELLR